MRVLLLTQYFWPDNFIINELAVALSKRGLKVDILTGMPNYPSGRFPPGYGGPLPLKTTYHGLSVLRVPHLARGSSRISLIANYLSFPISACLFGRRLRDRHYDAILTYAPSPATIGLAGLYLKRVLRARLIFWVQDLWPESVAEIGGLRGSLLQGYLENMVRRIYRGSDRILVSSRAFEPAVVAKGAEPRKLSYVPNTADPIYHPIAPPEAPLVWNVPEGAFKIVFGGNIGAAQDIETVIDAAAAIRHHRGGDNIHWIFIGDGRHRNRAVERADILGVRETVHFLGSRSREEMPMFYALADALLITLRGGGILDLTVPSKLQAYLACGRPILGGLSGAAAKIVKESGAGVCVTPGNASELADAAIYLSNVSPATRKAMGCAGRRYFVEHFGFDHIADKLLQSVVDTIEQAD